MKEINCKLIAILAGISLSLALSGCQNPFLQLGKEAAAASAYSPFMVSPPEDSEGSLFTVSFITNGGSPVASIPNVAPGSLISEPESSMDYFIVEGWYKDPDLDDPWDFSYDEVNSNLTLYAGWEFDEDAQGDGSEEYPFLVYDIITLDRVGSEAVGVNKWAMNSHYLQIKDIDWAKAGINWTPIGKNFTDYFLGVYDGGGKIIFNLECILPPGDSYAGLFIALKGTVKNLGLVNAVIEGKNNVGGIASFSDFGTIQNCFFRGSIKGEYNIGGISGSNGLGLIENCYADCDINGTFQIGGITGMNNGGRILNCYALGSVSGTYNAGGIAGRSTGSETENCVALNSLVKTTGNPVGRVHGGNTLLAPSDAPFVITNCYGSADMDLICGAARTPDSSLDGNDVGEERSAESWWIDTANWDFDHVWAWDAVKKLPVLQNMNGQ